MLAQFLGRFAALLLAAAALAQPAAAQDTKFTIAVIPDTQNYMDYTHQKAEGFPFDASEQFLEQMRFIAANVESAGGEIAFVTAVGDVWQHQTLPIDPAHAARGFTRVANPMLDRFVRFSEKVPSVEMPKAAEGYRLIAGKVPFSVVPGNHDYDAMWPVDPPKGADGKPKVPFLLHVGGLNNFSSVFGPQSEFFRDKPWYVSSNAGGGDSAQIFTAGGYRFSAYRSAIQSAKFDLALGRAGDAALSRLADYCLDARFSRHPGPPPAQSDYRSRGCRS